MTDFALWGGLVPGNRDSLDELAERGVIGFKAFMSNSGLPEFPRADDLTLYEGMRVAARHDLLVAVHAESDELKQLVETMDHAANKGDAVQYYRLNLQFHDSIATFARHKRGKQTYESLIKELHLFRRSNDQ